MARRPEAYYVYMKKSMALVGMFETHKVARQRAGQGKHSERALVNTQDAKLRQNPGGGTVVVLSPREPKTKRSWYEPI